MHSPGFSRQPFLGTDSQRIIESVFVAIVGLGGGGSHICSTINPHLDLLK